MVFDMNAITVLRIAKTEHIPDFFNEGRGGFGYVQNVFTPSLSLKERDV